MHFWYIFRDFINSFVLIVDLHNLILPMVGYFLSHGLFPRGGRLVFLQLLEIARPHLTWSTHWFVDCCASAVIID